MGFLQQTWTLTVKNLMIVFLRHWLTTSIRAFLAPIIFMFFISYSKNFFVPPSDFGVGSPTPLRTLPEALAAAGGGRSTVAFVNNGNIGGEISAVIDRLAITVTQAGAVPVVVATEQELLDVCPSSLRGATACYAAASFHSSPTEGDAGAWNYTLRADGAFGISIFVTQDDNDQEIYVLPFQHAIDAAIASQGGGSIPEASAISQFPYTSRTNEQLQRNITRLYMGTLINILALAYFIGFVGVTYQLVGSMATERELGMSQLIESMVSGNSRWKAQAARLISFHLAYDILYLPGWIIMPIIVANLTFPTSSVGLVLGYHVLCGLALSSWSIMFGSLFRKAQLSGITVVIVSILLAIVAQVTRPWNQAAVIVLSLLCTPINYTLFIIYLARWEQGTLAADISRSAPGDPTPVVGYVFWILLIIQIIVFPLVGALIERTLYGTASKSRKITYGASESSNAVELAGLSKHYEPGWWNRNLVARLGGKRKETVKAVNELNMSVRTGQIMVLLGANGSGKSTTLDAIAGLSEISAGSITIDGTGGMGLCPQKNVLWDELTVFEHVKIFNRLKSTHGKDPNDKIKDLVAQCDLQPKIGARSKTLSGGQKRKLQLAMMFTGGSKVCAIDEVSSGLDPLSRRKIWDILLAERGRRTMLLTTHFLDEADLLSDEITILSKGNLKAAGSAVELKHKLGGGYRVHIYHDTKFDVPPELAGIPKVVLYDQTVYQLGGSAQAAQFVAAIEQAGLKDYQVNGPTIEDVFLKLAEEVQAELQQGPEHLRAELSETGSDKGTTSGEAKPTLMEQERGPDLRPGRQIGLARQTWVLFRKRFTILRRNWLPYAIALLIPIVAAGLVTFFLEGFQALSCQPNPEPERRFTALDLVAFGNPQIPAGPQSVFEQDLGQLAQPFPPEAFQGPLGSTEQLVDYITENYTSSYPGGLFSGPNGGSQLFAYEADRSIAASVVTQNLLDRFLLNQVIEVGYQAFQGPWSPNAGDTLQLVLYFGLAMCAYPGFFALYPTVERLRNVRALHYSNGVRAGPLWMAYTLFDLTIVLVASIVAIVIFIGASGVWYYPGYLFVVFFLYGLTSILMSYVVSLFVTSQLAAFAFAAGGQCSFFLIYFVAFMCILTYIPASDVDQTLLIAHFTIALVTPSGNLLRALFLALNNFSITCDGEQLAPYPGAITVYGGPILYLVVQAAVLLLILVWYDSGYKPAVLQRSAQREKHIEESQTVDDDLANELSRVRSTNDGLRVLHLDKSFGDFQAVDDITFGVTRGETFALLGPNGAGKSTTISLIRGDIRPSNADGEIFVENISITKKRAAARAHLGVCPQFDAMDSMTVLEHLRFYARVRGVKEVEHNVAEIVRAVGLEPFKGRMAAKLSGGNKRKLSLGIALMGDPTVVLLDEPSSGMDAASKRVMWRTLKSIKGNRSLVLTTHSMEEADALADRAGIMAKSMLAMGTSESLRRKHGNAYHVHLVHKAAPHTSEEEMERVKRWIVHNIPGAATEDKSFHGQVRFSVPTDLTTEGPVNYETKSGTSSKTSSSNTLAPNTGGKQQGIAALFALLESNRDALGFEYYSVSQTTLDQVFLTIVGKHNVLEENYEREHAGERSAWSKTKSGFMAVMRSM